MRPEVVLWDWDNTLVDGWAGIRAALNVVFSAHGLPEWSHEETRARVRKSLKATFPDLFGADWQAAVTEFRVALAKVHLDHLRPMPGALAMLRASAGLPQGVVSNKEGRFLRMEVAHLGLNEAFRAVVGAGDAAADKPDPAPILHALTAMRVTPGRGVWYIGDTGVDMRAAHAAGCTAVLLGDAAHDGGVGALAARGAAPHLHFIDAFTGAKEMSARILDASVR